MISFKVGGSNLQKIAIITDSGCDLSQETIKENNIHKVEETFDEKVNLGDIYERYVR